MPLCSCQTKICIRCSDNREIRGEDEIHAGRRLEQHSKVWRKRGGARDSVFEIARPHPLSPQPLLQLRAKVLEDFLDRALGKIKSGVLRDFTDGETFQIVKFQNENVS